MDQRKKTRVLRAVVGSLSAAAVVAGCAQFATGSGNANADALAMMKSSFKSQGPVTVEAILGQDEAQKLCSRYVDAVPENVARQIEEVELKSIKPPSDGKYLGDWKRGEVVAQNGVGMQFSDKVDGVNGGNCYACHQLAPREISYGNIGPSLFRYGKLRGNSDAIVQYTWGKIYDAQAYRACSNMPRFGHNRVLTEQQMKDVVALLLDPASPVNQ
ncbi:MAG: sulfur oxidation c-type cytochrome SoxX [Burkholderiaceae bacterium]